MNKTLGIVLGVVGAALLGAVAATIGTVYYFKTAQQSVEVPQIQQADSAPQQIVQNTAQLPVEQPPQELAPQTLPVLSQEQIQDPGVVWLPQPQKISKDLKLFKIPDSDYASPENLPPGVKQPKKVTYIEATYYKTGTDNGNDIILATIPPEGPGNDLLAYLRKTSAGSYEYILQNSENYDAEQKQFYTAMPIDAVKINTQTLYASIQTQKTLTYQGVGLTNMSGYEVRVPEKNLASKRVQVAQTPYGILTSETQEGPVKELTVQSFFLVKQNGLEEAYQYTPADVLHDNSVADVLWNNGEQNTDTYTIINTTGCGAGSYLPLLSDPEISKIIPTGKTSKGETVYGFSNPNDPVIQYLYKATNGTYYGSDGKTHTISLKEFQNIHPAFVIKDVLGRYVVYNNSTWGPAVECGKPVIYLYPQQPTQVSVRVDADITKSDPAYMRGWNVRALPNGTLFINTASYDSLFWEGTGHGAYPDIRRGSIVAKKNLEKKLREDLSRLGLNQKESNDFLAFWLSKMPTTPYTRLSWLTTSDMNTLAPLTITPAPDTLIRVFLDFEGLEKPIDMKPQLLAPSLPRNGFSVIEWGGLLKK